MRLQVIVTRREVRVRYPKEDIRLIGEVSQVNISINARCRVAGYFCKHYVASLVNYARL